MTDYQRVVDEIRSLLQASDQTYTDSFKVLATAYAEACQEANQRLRRCEEFLQKGLRSEAIHFAQAEPVLLDVVAVLDFPERKQWEELALAYALPPPPPLRIDTAEALNRAYAEEQPVEHLLGEHRRLALIKAPLRERLAVMRQIARHEPGNPIWAEDIAAFEVVRLREIEEEVEQALHRNDSDTLFALGDELQTIPWIVLPAQPLTARIQEEMARREHLRLRKALEKVAQELARAHTTRDERRARDLREQWNRLNGRAQLVRQDPLWRLIAPALQWLASVERRHAEDFAYQTALEQLERAFAEDVSDEELQERYYAVRKCKRGIPVAVEERYRQRIETSQTTASRRERYILVTTFSLGMAALVAFLLFVVIRGH